MTEGYYRFKIPAIFTVTGPDTVRYMNARLSQRVDDLESGEYRLAAALNGQGRTLGFFTFFSTQNGFILYQDEEQTDSATAAFLKFKVADRVEVTSLTGYRLVHVLAPAGSSFPYPLPDKDLSVTSVTYILRRDRLGSPGYDILFPESDKTLNNWLQSEPAMSDEQFEYKRVNTGFPSFPREINESTFFLEADVADAYSSHKGCYVGQEAIEMALSRGKLPAKIMRFSLPGGALPEKGAKVINPGQSIAIGSVISAIRDPSSDTVFGFARIRKYDDAERLEVTIGDVSGRLFNIPQRQPADREAG